MGHNITAIILKGEFKSDIATQYDLFFPIQLSAELTMFHIDHYYSAVWQKKLGISGRLDLSDIGISIFPSEEVLARVMQTITDNEDPLYAIIFTEYFGGNGFQAANVFLGNKNADKRIVTINEALSYLGVTRDGGNDEFDTIGLRMHRSQPEYLDKYVELADELGIYESLL